MTERYWSNGTYVFLHGMKGVYYECGFARALEGITYNSPAEEVGNLTRRKGLYYRFRVRCG